MSFKGTVNSKKIQERSKITCRNRETQEENFKTADPQQTPKDTKEHLEALKTRRTQADTLEHLRLHYTELATPKGDKKH